MKNRGLISLLLVVVMLVSALPLATAPALAAPPSGWAVPEMNEANINGLLTPSAARNFRKDLTRDEFCEIVVEMVERARGNPLPLPNTNPFTDTNSIYILKAFQYGITNGTTATTFSPNASVQRQQICAMMLRAIQGLEKELGRTLLNPPAQSLPYSDVGKIAPYAVEAARYAYTNNIMRGDESQNLFSPIDPITSEQCVAVAIRSFIRMEDVLASYRTAEQNLDATEERLTIGYAFGDSEYGVTQNIILPTSGSGGAVIAWTSSNTGVISIGSILYGADNATPIGRIGVVTVGSSSQSVTLTATITLGNQTRTQTFDLRTSTLQGDQLLLANAASLLDIIYINAGDSATSVTGRIGLPNKVLDLPVTWSTSNANVVTNTGIVYTPSGSEVRQATLTATIRNGSQTRTKTFELTIVNAQYNRSATLNGVELGATPARVTQVLGNAVKTIQASSTESWQLYHSGSYSGFIAVAFVNNRAVAVFSMASNAANQLRNNAGTVITVEQANAINGVNAVSYVDTAQQYAIMIYESNSVIGSQRTLTAEGQEEILFELVKAYRVRYGVSALEWTDKLKTPARAHSTWNVGSAPNFGTGSNALTFRAEEAGFTATGNYPLYGGGNVMAGQNDAFGFLREMAGTAAMRNEILSGSATLFGAGFVSATTGTYRTYLTYMLGNVKFITGVTASPVSGSPATVRISGIGTTVTVSLTPAYTSLISSNSYNEPFTATSSNENRIGVEYTAGSSTCVVKGITTGDANLVITGKLSGKSYNIPINVGAVYATSLQVTYPANGNVPAAPLTNSSSSVPGNVTLVTGVNEAVKLTAYAVPATTGTTPTVVWAQSGVNYTSVSSENNGANYSFTPTSAGTATVTASVPLSSGVNIIHTITVRVLAAPTITQSPLTVNTYDTVTLAAALTNTAGGPPTHYTWESGNSGILSRAALATETDSAVFSAVGAGTATVTFTAEWRSVQLLGKVTGLRSVTVSGSLYATSFELSPPGPIYLVYSPYFAGPTATIIAVPLPSSATYSSVTFASTAPSVAAIDPTGVVSAVGNGTAYITANMGLTAGSTSDLTSSNSVAVIVNDSVTIVGSPGTMPEGGSAPLQHSLIGALPAGVDVVWASSDSSVIEILLVSPTPGTVSVKAKEGTAGQMATIRASVMYLGNELFFAEIPIYIT